MRSILNYIPSKVRSLLAFLGISLVGLFITRLLFYVFNLGAFEGMGLYYWILGLIFDVMTICLLMLPFYIIYLLPINTRNRLYSLFLKIVFHFINSVMLALNLLDVEYFKYTGKRSTADLFTTVGTGNDVGQLLGSFLADFWYLILIFIFLIVGTEWMYRKVANWTINQFSLKREVISFFIVIPLLFIIGRGGFGLRPIGIIEAANYTDGEFTAFVLPTPFTIIKTISQKGLEEKKYFASNQELEKYFDPIKHSQPANILDGHPNVVVIILESFGNEFVGHYNPDNKGYTPFLDSILNRSLVFENAFANGKKSIEAFPAINASLPTLMDEPYINSAYGMNKLDGLPEILKKYGYSSAFYHGATNGSMSFDGFAKICGFEKYVGRSEYNNEKHSDKKWGILDEYFNPWSAKQMSTLKQPFYASLFTLSSHHPYYIPAHMKAKVKKGPQEICASISYADYSLKLFFQEAKKQPWYKNTVFVLLADHTPASTTSKYYARHNLYRIPIAIYDPMGRIQPERSNRIFQQTDVTPTILDLLNIETKFYSFGSSFYQNKDGEAITYLAGTYYYFYWDRMFVFTNDKIVSVKSMKYGMEAKADDELLKKVELRIKAIIQTYNRDLIHNKTSVR